MSNSNLDRENLRQVILDFPEQFAIGLEKAKEIQPTGSFDALVISGMGGSCLPGNILKTYLEATGRELEIIQNRTYSLPKKSFENSLNFILSYSGNTEETISCLEEAVSKNISCVCFASGGKMVEICQEKNIPCVLLPSGIQPRYATGYFFSSMLQILQNANLIREDLEEISSSGRKLKETIQSLESKGREISAQLAKKTPLIYTTDKYKALAMVMKIKINENAKTPAFWNYFPELNHNEMVGFSLPQGAFHVLTLMDIEEHPQNIKRMKITAELYKQKGIETTFLDIQGETVFEKIFSTLILGDWISYYLSLSYGQDPTPVEMVEEFKKLLT